MNSQPVPELAILLNESLPTDFAADEIDGLSDPNVSIGVVRMPGGPYAGVELYLPGAVALFIASAYFAGALQKAGEEHYEIVKRAAQTLWARCSKMRVTSVGSAGKVDKGNKFSPTYSIMGQVEARLTLKLVLPKEIDARNANLGICAFLEFLRDLHSGNLDSKVIASLLTCRPVGGVVIVTFDAGAGRIIPIDPFRAHEG